VLVDVQTRQKTKFPSTRFTARGRQKPFGAEELFQ